MTDIDYEVFLSAADEIAKERGDFALFILVLRDEMASVMSTATSGAAMSSRWDVVMSAPWIEVDRRAPLEYVAGKIEKHGGKTALGMIGRLVAVPMSDPLVKRVTEQFQEPRPFKSSAGVRGTGGVHLIEPWRVGPGVVKVLLVTASRDPKVKKRRRGK